MIKEISVIDSGVQKMTDREEINNLLQQMLLQIQSILSDNFVGMYIGGSLANNNFNCESSDIDCYIITTSMLPKNVINKIEEMHKWFYSSKFQYAQRIEASYIPQKDLSNFDPKNKRPYFNEGNYYLAHYGNNFKIELCVLRDKGITIVGPDIKHLIKAISTQNLKQAIHNNLAEYWDTSLNDLSKFRKSDYQVFSVLTMCRTLYSLDTGKIVSKIEAAQWAISKLESNWRDLVEQALAWKPGQELNKLEETQQFVRYILDRTCNKNI